MRRRGWIGLVGSGVAVALFAAVWLVLAPPRLGGSTEYAIVVGSSMQPRLHRGDLVLVRRAGGYRVGEIVLYRNRILGRAVLHRIVREQGGRFVFKGDNNSFLDPGTATRSELVGRLWLRLPGVGRAFGWLRRPAHAALVAGLAALLMLTGAFGLDARSRGRPKRRRTARPNPPLSPALLGAGGQAALAGLAALCAGFLVLTAVTYARPPQQTLQEPAYRQQGVFGYAGVAPAGAAYPHGLVRTGAPVFLELVKRLRLRFSYRFTSRFGHDLAERARLLVELQDLTTGWRRTLMLTSWRRFRAERFTLDGSLKLSSLETLIRRLERENGLQSASYTLTLRAQVALAGQLAGRKISDSFSPSLPFQLDPLLLRLAPAQASGQPTGPSLIASKRATMAQLTPARLRLFGLKLAVADARRLGMLGALSAFAAGLLLTLLLLARRLRQDEPHRIAALYGPMLLPVAALPRASELRTIELTDADSLARLAHAAEQPILHEQRDRTHTYTVDYQGARYSYQAASGPAAGVTQQPQPAPAPPQTTKPAEATVDTPSAVAPRTRRGWLGLHLAHAPRSGWEQEAERAPTAPTQPERPGRRGDLLAASLAPLDPPRRQAPGNPGLAGEPAQPKASRP